MAINDDATLVLGAGNFFTAPVGTAIPADLTAPGVAWENVGHTSLDDVFGVSSDGGDATVLKTLQNRSLRTVYADREETFNININQFDKKSLKLYYGSNAVELADGSIGVPSKPVATSCAFLAVFVDGDNHFGLYVPKSEILRSDDWSAGDAESLVSLPLGIKTLQNGSNAWTYAVTPLGETG